MAKLKSRSRRRWQLRKKGLEARQILLHIWRQLKQHDTQSILKHGLDRRPPPRPAGQGELLPDHPNIRGPRYYH